MGRKITIKALCSGSEGYYTKYIPGELYESNGFQFCIHWSEDGREVTASELSTGMSVGTVTRWRSNAPKRELLKRVDTVVGDGTLKKAVDDFRVSLAGKRAALLEQLNKFPALPINEPIKSIKTPKNHQNEG